MAIEHNVTGDIYEYLSTRDSFTPAMYVADVLAGTAEAGEYQAVRRALIDFAEGRWPNEGTVSNDLERAARAVLIVRAAGSLGLTVSGEIK